ncbi:MAG: insulinase family protein [bacterium]|nr:insulinase family protein [bacterium]
MKIFLRLLAISLLLTGCTAVEIREGAPTSGVTLAARETRPPDTAPLDAEIPLDPALRHGRFDNGLAWYVRANRKPEKRAELRFFLNVGSLQEDDDQQGLAHFMEHMAFNGSLNFEKKELISYLETIGMRYGADINAYTSYDETVLMLTVPTDDSEVLAKAFLILEDWAHNLTLDEQAIDTERGVLIEEWRIRRGAGARLADQQIPVLYRNSRYAERLPIGKKEVLENAPYEAVRRFYGDWYRPDLMAVVAVGDFDPDKVEHLIRRHFGAIGMPETVRPREIWPVPGHRETLWSFTTDPEVTRTSVSVYYKLPRPETGTFGDYRNRLIEKLYSSMLNERLGEIARLADPPFLSGYSATYNLARSRLGHIQSATVEDGGVERGLEAVLVEAERVDRHGFTPTELERAKRDLERNYQHAYRERDSQPSSALAAECGRNFLEGESMPGIEIELELVRRFLPTIDLAEVNRLAESWITDENRVVLVSGPEKAGVPLPTKDDLLAVFDSIGKHDIAPWIDEVRDEPLVAEAPEPGKVVSEKTIEEVGVTEWRLANGVRVVLKPTDFHNDQILLIGSSPGGHSLVADEDHPSAIVATDIIAESGFGSFSSIELRKALAGKVVAASAYISEREEGIQGRAASEDLETLFELLYLSFTAPRFDPEAYQSLRTRWQIRVENRLSRPETVWTDQMRRAQTQGHRRRRPFSKELISEIDPEKALAIYRDRFADATDFTFVLVGNFQLAEIRPLIETWLGGLPAAGRRESWRDVGVEMPQKTTRVEVSKGLEPKSLVRLYFYGPAEWSRESQSDIQALAEVLLIRLREELREKLGVTYGAWVRGALSLRPKQEYSFRIGFGCAPEEVDHLTEVLFAELRSIQENGIDESYLDKVKEAARRQREVDLKENSFWLYELRSSYIHGHDPRWILELEESSRAVTVERLRSAARLFIDEERYVIGVLYPEGESAGSPSAGSDLP